MGDKRGLRQPYLFPFGLAAQNLMQRGRKEGWKGKIKVGRNKGVKEAEQ